MHPLALLVDDGCPLIHVYHYHRLETPGALPRTRDGRPLVETIPNSFLEAFCAVCERWGMAGKFSIVPAPAGRGDVAHGIEGFPLAETRAWVQTVQQRLGARFDFTPEGITHYLTVDLTDGTLLPINENDWSQTQTRATLTPYLTRSLELLRAAGVDANGFTSPWVFGLQVEPEYVAAMVAAQRAVYGRADSWYFLHVVSEPEKQRPWVAHRDARGTLVSIPATIEDHWWETIDNPNAVPAAIARRAYEETVRVAESGGVPVVLTHWQSLFSNGLRTGLTALDEYGRLIAADGRFMWRSCWEMAREYFTPS